MSKKKRKGQADATKTVVAGQTPVQNAAPRDAATRDQSDHPPRRPFWLVILLFVVFGAICWLSNAVVSGFASGLAQAVRTTIRGVGVSSVPSGLVDHVEFDIPSSQWEKVEGIDVQIYQIQIKKPPKLFEFSRQQFLDQWKISKPNGVTGRDSFHVIAPDSVSAEKSLMPWYHSAVNWGGDWNFLRYSMPDKLLILLGAILAIMLVLRWSKLQGVEKWLFGGLAGGGEETAAPPCRPWDRWLWPALMSLAFVAAMVILEVNQPYHFTQDDSLVNNQPYMLQGCRSAFSGVLPEWNPYQFMGVPAMSLGFTTLLYLPTYLAYAIARFVFGDEYLMVEVHSIMHLAVGCLLTYWAARKIGIGRPLAATGSLCAVLCGSWLLGGRDWHNVLIAAVWVPLLVILAVDLKRGRLGWKWLVLSVAVITIFFSEGFPQYWLYPMMCVVLAVAILTVTGRIPLDNLLWYVAALFLSAALILPMVVLQTDWASDMVRPPAYGLGVERGILAMLFPHPITHAEFPGNLGIRPYTTEYYYSGTLFCLATFLGWGVLTAYRWQRGLVARNVWLISALLPFLISLGSAGVVWPLMSQLPILGKANNNPFRALPYFNFFAVLGGGLVLEGLLRPLRNRRKWEIGLAAVGGALILYHTSIARPAFFEFGDKPYPPLPEGMAKLLNSSDPLNSHRFISIGTRKNTQPGFALGLSHTFPSVYSVLSFYGDDPTIVSKPLFAAAYQRMEADPLAAAQAYGIRWLVVHKGVMDIYELYYHPDKLRAEYASGLRNSEEFLVTHGVGSGHDIFRPLYASSHTILDYPDVEVRELPGPCRPLAFAESSPDTPLPIHLSGRGATVDVSSLKDGGAVIVNFLSWPHMKAVIDGQPVAEEPDEWGRVRAHVPAGAKTLEVLYSPPWGKGALYGAAVALATALGAVAVRVLGKRHPKQG